MPSRFGALRPALEKLIIYPVDIQLDAIHIC